jgi:hypothetical protein
MGVEEEKSISFSDLKVHRNRNTINLGILGSLRELIWLYCIHQIIPLTINFLLSIICWIGCIGYR